MRELRRVTTWEPHHPDHYSRLPAIAGEDPWWPRWQQVNLSLKVVEVFRHRAAEVLVERQWTQSRAGGC